MVTVPPFSVAYRHQAQGSCRAGWEAAGLSEGPPTPHRPILRFMVTASFYSFCKMPCQWVSAVEMDST